MDKTRGVDDNNDKTASADTPTAWSATFKRSQHGTTKRIYLFISLSAD
jgi:hypothetical protein